MELSFKPRAIVEESLILYEGDTGWSEEYKLLTGDFYQRRMERN